MTLRNKCFHIFMICLLSLPFFHKGDKPRSNILAKSNRFCSSEAFLMEAFLMEAFLPFSKLRRPSSPLLCCLPNISDRIWFIWSEIRIIVSIVRKSCLASGNLKLEPISRVVQNIARIVNALSSMLHILARQDSMILHFNMVWLSWWVPSFSIGLFPKPKTGREFATFLLSNSDYQEHYQHSLSSLSLLGGISIAFVLFFVTLPPCFFFPFLLSSLDPFFVNLTVGNL